jgi:hypothetical protein
MVQSRLRQRIQECDDQESFWNGRLRSPHDSQSDEEMLTLTSADHVHDIDDMEAVVWEHLDGSSAKLSANTDFTRSRSTARSSTPGKMPKSSDFQFKRPRKGGYHSRSDSTPVAAARSRKGCQASPSAAKREQSSAPAVLTDGSLCSKHCDERKVSAHAQQGTSNDRPEEAAELAKLDASLTSDVAAMIVKCPAAPKPVSAFRHRGRVVHRSA